MWLEVALFFGVLYLLYYFSNKRPDGYPKGPSGLPVVGYMFSMTYEPHKKFQLLKKKYGDIFSVKLGSFNCVILNSNEAIREAFREDVFSGRPDINLFTERTGGRKNGVINSEGHHWTEQRRFTLRHLRDFGFGKGTMEELIHDEIKDLMEGFRSASGAPLDLEFKFNLAVVNALWNIITGTRYKQDDPKLEALFRKVNSVVEDFGVSGIAMFLPWILNIPGVPKLIKWGEFRETMDDMRADMMVDVEEHKSTFKDDSMRDFIDVYLKEINSTQDSNSSFYKEEGEFTLVSVLQDLFFAGADTTSTTLLWMIRFMMAYPEKQKIIQQEIDDVIGRDRLPSLKDRPSLPYTEAVIWETLRMSSIVPVGVFHSAMEDTTFRGYKIPKDTMIVSNLYCAMNDEEYWDRPREFRPERFLNEDGKLQKNDSLIPFSTGKRQCLGESLARDSLFLFTTSILQQFTIKIPPGDRVATLERNSAFRVKPEPFKVVLKERY